MDETVLRIKAPHFVAGMVYSDAAKSVTKTAPIVGYMLGWGMQRVKQYTRKKGWELEVE